MDPVSPVRRLRRGCAHPDSYPHANAKPVETEKVRFTTDDGVTLSGTLFLGGGDMAVVLAHQGAGQPSQESWHSFAEAAARIGITALPFDFRNDFGGPLDRDVVAAIRYLRGRGYTRIACIGASMGGMASLKAAQTEDVAGVGVIGSTWSTGQELSVSRAELAALKIPTLFVTTDNDRFEGVVAAVKEMCEAAPEPKTFREYPRDRARHRDLRHAAPRGLAQAAARLSRQPRLRQALCCRQARPAA